MAIEFRKKGDVQVLDFTGRITITDASTVLKEGFRQALDAGEKQFVFNLTATPYIDSSTIGETIACIKRVRERDGDIKFVVPPTGRVRDILRLTALDRVMEIYEDEDSAVVSFAP